MRTVPRPCTRHRRPDARNEIAGTSPRRQPEGRTVFGLSLFTPHRSLPFPWPTRIRTPTPGKHRRREKAAPAAPVDAPAAPSPTRLSVQGLHMRHSPAAQRALHRPRATRSGAAHEKPPCSTPLPCTEALHRPRTQKRGPGVKASGTVRKTLRPDTRSPAAPHASARLRFAQVQFRK